MSRSLCKLMLCSEWPNSEQGFAIICYQGDITDLASRLYYLQQKIRLCIIDYAGSSTYPEDIIDFLTTYTNICEIAIEHGSHVEVLSRHQPLKNNEVEKFNCRPVPVQRSK
ncbi:unnamed protein product [Rhizopus microsporus]